MDDDQRMGPVGTVVAMVLAAAVGVFAGAITTFTHRQWPEPLPWGVIAGVAVIAAIVAGFRIVFDSRLVAGAAAVGALAAMSLLALPGAGGSALVLDDAIGRVWAFAPTVVSAIVLAWPRPRRRGARPGGPVPTT
jgi:hypothetical protein